MDKHSQHLEYVKSELTEGLGVLADDPSMLDLSITVRQVTTSTKTNNVKPKLQLHTAERRPVNRHEYPDAPDLEMGQKQATALLDKESEDLSAYYAEIETVVDTEPHKILSLTPADVNMMDMKLQPKAYGCGIESCESCHESGKVTCKNCDGKCRVTCSKCSGQGQYIQHYQETLNEMCRSCGGAGKSWAYNQFQPCPQCFGGRRNNTYNRQRWVACGSCEKSGLVPCKTCSANGIVNCGHCDAKGSFLTEYKGVARYSMESVTTYDHESLDGGAVKDINPEGITPDKVTYTKLQPSAQGVVTATETKQFLVTEVISTYPAFKDAKFILCGSQETPHIHSQSQGFADSLLNELLAPEKIKNTNKKTKAIDVFNKVPALVGNSRLSLFSSRIKDSVKEVKSSFAADVFQKAKGKRFGAMLMLWPMTFVLMFLAAYFINIPLTLFFGEEVFQKMTYPDNEGATIFVMALISIVMGTATYKIVEAGNLHTPGKVPGDIENHLLKRWGYFLIIGAGAFVTLFIVISYCMGIKEYSDKLFITAAILAAAQLFPSFFVARAKSARSAKEYLDRITRGRV